VKDVERIRKYWGLPVRDTLLPHEMDSIANDFKLKDFIVAGVTKSAFVRARKNAIERAVIAINNKIIANQTARLIELAKGKP